jgi:hypothetical protein
MFNFRNKNIRKIEKKNYFFFGKDILISMNSKNIEKAYLVSSYFLRSGYSNSDLEFA